MLLILFLILSTNCLSGCDGYRLVVSVYFEHNGNNYSFSSGLDYGGDFQRATLQECIDAPEDHIQNHNLNLWVDMEEDGTFRERKIGDVYYIYKPNNLAGEYWKYTITSRIEIVYYVSVIDSMVIKIKKTEGGIVKSETVYKVDTYRIKYVK